MKKSLKIRLFATFLSVAMILGSIGVSALTIPAVHVDYLKTSSLTYKTVYNLSPSSGYDQFGILNPAGAKYHVDDSYVYLDTYEFLAGSTRLDPSQTYESAFEIYGRDARTNERFELWKTTPSSGYSMKYAGTGNYSGVKVEKYVEGSTSSKGEIFMAFPTWQGDLVMSFTAPSDGSYSFSETVVKLFNYVGYNSTKPSVEYSVVKSDLNGAETVLKSVTTNVSDGENKSFTLESTADLKAGEKLLFIMAVSDTATALGAFNTRVMSLSVTSGNNTYTLTEIPQYVRDSATYKGYAKDGHDYFWYTSDTTKDADFLSTDLFGMQANGNNNPVIAFVVPTDGSYTWTSVLRRATSGSSSLRIVRNGETLQTVNVTSSATTITQSFVAKQGEKIYLEYLANGSADKLYVTKMTTSIDSLRTGELDPEYNNDGQTPLYTIAMISDIHSDGDYMTREVPVRSTFTAAVNYIKGIGKADVILVGGDTVSEAIYHSANFEKSNWTKDNIIYTLDYIDEQLSGATKTGKNILYIVGNHDKQPGVVVEAQDTTDTVRIYSGNYSPYMLNRTGEYKAAFYMADLVGKENCRYEDEVLCYRYEIDGMEYIGINQPYTSYPNANIDKSYDQLVYPEQITWVREQLADIGKDKTVMLLCHYGIYEQDYLSYTAPVSKRHLGEPALMMLETLEEYPNVIYNYGHIHWRNDDNYVWYNTSEHTKAFGTSTLNSDNSYTTTGYHYLHMGATGFTPTKYQTTTTASTDPKLAQIMIVDFYKDHITFQTVNVGENSAVEGVYELTSYTVKREMDQLDAYHTVADDYKYDSEGHWSYCSECGMQMSASSPHDISYNCTVCGWKSYSVTFANENNVVEIDDTLDLTLKVGGGIGEYASSKISISFSTDYLTFNKDASTLYGATVTDDGEGNITIYDHGDTQYNGESYVLNFTPKQLGDTTVTVTEAGFSTRVDAEYKNLTPANVSEGEASVNICKAKFKINYDADRFDATSEEVSEGGSVTLTPKNKNYTYVLSADGYTVTKNDDGTFTISNIVSEVTVNIESETPKTYTVTPSYEGDASEGDFVGEGSATYNSDYTFKIPVDLSPSTDVDGYTYTVSSNVPVVKSDTPVNGYYVYTIKGENVTENITVTVRKTKVGTTQFSVSVNNSVITAEPDSVINKGQSLTLNFAPNPGYTYEISVTMGGATVSGIDWSDNKHVIESVEGTVVVTVTENKIASFKVYEYVTYNNATSAWLIINEAPQMQSHSFAYKGVNMYWSDRYGAYATVVFSETRPTPSADDLTVVEGIQSIDYNYNVNGSTDDLGSPYVDINDAQLTYNIYTASYNQVNDRITVKKLLSADVNSVVDYKVNVLDAAAIINQLIDNE